MLLFPLKLFYNGAIVFAFARRASFTGAEAGCFAAFERSLTNIRFQVEKNNDLGKYILFGLILEADCMDLSLIDANLFLTRMTRMTRIKEKKILKKSALSASSASKKFIRLYQSA